MPPQNKILSVFKIHHKCCQTHSFQSKQKKQRQTTKNNEFFRCHNKKTSQIFDHKIHNKCPPKHSFQSKQKKNKEKQGKTKNNKQKQKKQKSKKCDLKKAHHKKDLLARS